MSRGVDGAVTAAERIQGGGRAQLLGKHGQGKPGPGRGPGRDDGQRQGQPRAPGDDLIDSVRLGGHPVGAQPTGVGDSAARSPMS